MSRRVYLAIRKHPLLLVLSSGIGFQIVTLSLKCWKRRKAHRSQSASANKRQSHERGGTAEHVAVLLCFCSDFLLYSYSATRYLYSATRYSYSIDCSETFSVRRIKRVNIDPIRFRIDRFEREQVTLDRLAFPSRA